MKRINHKIMTPFYIHLVLLRIKDIPKFMQKFFDKSTSHYFVKLYHLIHHCDVIY